MTDEDLKKIQKLIKDEIRPVKETTEIIQSKMSGFDLYQRSTSSTVRSLKDQLSVVNEKIDGMKGDLTGMKGDLTGMKGDLTGMKGDLTGMKGDLDRVKCDLEEKIEQRITSSEQKIIKEIGDFVEKHLLTQMDEKAEKHVTDRLENRVDHMADQASNHEGRIKKLEVNSNMASPTV